ncbi:hypothetical protein [Paenibacillus alkalitolerans]|uniref:hypothetical protein n=1 Tax=Paenibacillus alkalitolerans TaxID=2799335 RepID=UPI0018F2FBCE|nr:hypothetical protein [Paenibacillus alkalitolerans]
MEREVKLKSFIEQLVANAWPAYVQQAIGEWRLRAAFGVTKRANSVFTAGAFPDRSGEWMSVADDFFQRHSITPCYCVGDASPPELDGLLDAKGMSLWMNASS